MGYASCAHSFEASAESPTDEQARNPSVAESGLDRADDAVQTMYNSDVQSRDEDETLRTHGIESPVPVEAVEGYGSWNQGENTPIVRTINDNGRIIGRSDDVGLKDIEDQVDCAEFGQNSKILAPYFLPWCWPDWTYCNATACCC